MPIAGTSSVHDVHKIDFEPEFDDSLFTLELPEGVEIQEIGELVEEEVESLEEAAAIMEKPFLYIKETDEMNIGKMTVMYRSDGSPELSITYFKNELPYFTLSVFTRDEANIPFDGEGENIRGLKGEKTDMEGFRLLNWAEDGYGYNVMLEDPDLTFEEMKELLEEMEYVN